MATNTESMTHKLLSYFIRCVSVLSMLYKTRPVIKMHFLKLRFFWLYETGRVTARSNTSYFARLRVENGNCCGEQFSHDFVVIDANLGIFCVKNAQSTKLWHYLLS